MGQKWGANQLEQHLASGGAGDLAWTNEMNIEMYCRSDFYVWKDFILVQSPSPFIHFTCGPSWQEKWASLLHFQGCRICKGEPEKTVKQIVDWLHQGTCTRRNRKDDIKSPRSCGKGEIACSISKGTVSKMTPSDAGMTKLRMYIYIYTIIILIYQ